MPHNLFNSLQTFQTGYGRAAHFHSLPQLEKEGLGSVSTLPVSVRIVLESVLRNCDGKRIAEDDVRALADWRPVAEREREVPFVVARILLQDFTGVPLLADLAAMRSAAVRLNRNPKIIEPFVPVDLVIDHSVQVDYWSSPEALRLNMEMEFKRNRERYQFLKWGQQAFDGFSVMPPGIGICHQVNLEYLAKGVLERDGVFYPDTLVGTDSHTTMINGLGVAGWGVGGIEAEAGMLGQPIYFLMPDVIGVCMSGALGAGVTATDLVLHITQLLRKVNVVGKFVEFHGEGAATLSVPDRATIGNMSPEYGATMGYFPVDEESLRYYEMTGRTREQVETIRRYFEAQRMFGIPRRGECRYSQVIELDLAEVKPSVSGPRRPQDRIDLPDLKDRFLELLRRPVAEGGYGKTPEEINRRVWVNGGIRELHLNEPIHGGGEQGPESMPAGARGAGMKNTNAWTETEMINNRPTPNPVRDILPEEAPAATADIGHGDVAIAAITSCTNTSNPSVMLAAGLLAKKAVERGLRVSPMVKPSLAPGSRVVTEYYKQTGLQLYLDALGFNLAGYGCTTCIGNSGPLDPKIEEAITQNDLIAASVLSGNRNFEARVHQSLKANFLMSPPLVVAFAIAGRVNIDLTREPLGKDRNGKNVFLRDIWPTAEELRETMDAARDPENYRRLYASVAGENLLWNEIVSAAGDVYAWDADSTYIQEPPFFADFSLEPARGGDIKAARVLAIFGDSVTTDHISPAGAIKPSSPAGQYLRERGVEPEDFNTYGARRGNHEVMVRGTFANVRIKNRMVHPVEGGMTIHYPKGEEAGEMMNIYDAAMRYQNEGAPLMIFAGEEYGAGSSRDWAAKGSLLLGVRAVIARSFERIHRGNLVGMGVLPCQFPEGVNAQSLGLDGSDTLDLIGVAEGIKPRKKLKLIIHRASGQAEEVEVTLRIDTAIEVDYYRHGGILPYMLRQLVNQNSGAASQA
ncbi:MAG: aconitate hydratase [Blastocatellales bacterium]